MLLVTVACCTAIAANTITICHNAVSIKSALPYYQLIVDIFFLLMNQICIAQMQCHVYCCSLSLGPSMLVDCFFLLNILYFAVTACALRYCCHLPPVQIADCNLCQSAATLNFPLIVCLLQKKCWCTLPLLPLSPLLPVDCWLLLPTSNIAVLMPLACHSPWLTFHLTPSCTLWYQLLQCHHHWSYSLSPALLVLRWLVFHHHHWLFCYWKKSDDISLPAKMLQHCHHNARNTIDLYRLLVVFFFYPWC